MSKTENKISHSELLNLVHYDPLTGVFTARVHLSDKTRQGKVLGCISKKSGYCVIRLRGVLYRAHRLAWLYMKGAFPEEDIDHFNRIRSDNRFDNLRIANNSQNQANTNLSRNNSTGRKGVHKYKNRQKYVAYITTNLKRIHLGHFDTIEEAAEAYDKAALQYFGEYALTNKKIDENDIS